MHALVLDFGVAVRQLRAQRGWSQEHLAALSGLNRSYVGEVERGSVIASIVTMHKLASAMRVEPTALLARSAEIGQMRCTVLGDLASIAG